MKLRGEGEVFSGEEGKRSCALRQQGAASAAGSKAGSMGGASGTSTAVIGTVAQRKNRHESDILEAPKFKPLGLVSGFVPSKTCREYVEQDCAEALPTFRPHAAALIQAGREVNAALLMLYKFVEFKLLG